MNGIGFSIRDPSPMLKTAREQAVADAQARAQTYARAAGVTLGPMLAISEGGGDVPRPMPKVMYMARAAGPVPVAAGEGKRDRRRLHRLGNPLIGPIFTP